MTNQADTMRNLVQARVAIQVSASGATQLVAAQPAVLVANVSTGVQIRVTSLFLMALTANNIKFQSHVTPTDLTGLFYLAANGGFVLPYNERGWFATVAGEALDINLSAGTAVGGVLHYVTVR